MAYFAKSTIVEALKIIKDSEISVSVQCLSAIQYFIALDRFCHQRELEEKSAQEDTKEEHGEESGTPFLDGSSTAA